MVSLIAKKDSTRFALDASLQEPFTNKAFSDLINDSHVRGHDYYIARVHCIEAPEDSAETRPYSYFCYDAIHLCKYVFEMVISAEGRRISIRNFRDYISKKEISEINFFKLRCDGETPLRAEFVGNHVTFLESNVFRSKLFFQEDALDALRVNFQFKSAAKPQYIKRKTFFDLFLIVILLLLIGVIAFAAIRVGLKHTPAGKILVSPPRSFNKLT